MTQTPVRRRRPKDRRTMIERAAAELFAAQGFAGTGLSDIAAQVGVTPAAIYRHFASKDQLLETIILASLTSMDEAVRRAAVHDGQDAAARLREALGTMLDLGRADPDSVTIYIRERHRLDGPAKLRRHQSEVRLSEAIGSIVLELQPALPPRQLQARLRAMNGALASAAIHTHGVSPTRLRSIYVDGLSAVLQSPPDQPVVTPAHATPPWHLAPTRREELIDAAATLFRVHGFHGAGIDQIGEAAGISGPSVYGTYQSKADILVDTIDYAVSTLQVLTNQALARAGSAEEAIHIITESYAHALLTNTDVMAVATRDVEHLPDADRERIRRRQNDYRHQAQIVLLELRPQLSEAEALSLLAGAFALANEVALGRTPPTAEATGSMMVTFLLGAHAD